MYSLVNRLVLNIIIVETVLEQPLLLLQSMKVACTHFQCASGAFEYLRDHFGSAMMSLDFSHELLTFHVNLMLVSSLCLLRKYPFIVFIIAVDPKLYLLLSKSILSGLFLHFHLCFQNNMKNVLSH